MLLWKPQHSGRGRHLLYGLVIRPRHAGNLLKKKNHMSHFMRKPTMVRTGPTQTELYMHRRWREAQKLGFRKKWVCVIRVAKTKALISYALTMKLICAFVFTYAKFWVSRDMAHMPLMFSVKTFSIYKLESWSFTWITRSIQPLPVLT